MISIDNILELNPRRALDSHKRSCGTVGIIAGSAQMAGAAALAARAAYRSGAGLVTVLTEPSATQLVHQLVPEAIVLPITSHNGWIGAEAISEVLHAYERFNWDSIVLGPGLGLEESTRLFVRGLVSEIAELNIPILLDADALNALDMTYLSKHSFKHTIFTPHIGEFSRLTGQDVVSTNIMQIAQNFAQEIGGILVLKNHNTIVTDGYESFKNETGNAGMATAGMGDVLCGVIASIFSQGNISLLNAAVLGVYVHGLAGDKAYSEHGNGLMASDVTSGLGRVLLELEAQGIERRVTQP